MPYQPVILGPRYIVRLEDLTGADVYVVECLGCRRTWRVPPHRLHLRWPGYQRLLMLEPFLRCRGCPAGGEGHLTWSIERASPNGRAGTAGEAR